MKILTFILQAIFTAVLVYVYFNFLFTFFFTGVSAAEVHKGYDVFVIDQDSSGDLHEGHHLINVDRQSFSMSFSTVDMVTEVFDRQDYEVAETLSSVTDPQAKILNRVGMRCPGSGEVIRYKYGIYTNYENWVATCKNGLKIRWYDDGKLVVVKPTDNNFFVGKMEYLDGEYIRTNNTSLPLLTCPGSGEESFILFDDTGPVITGECSSGKKFWWNSIIGMIWVER